MNRIRASSLVLCAAVAAMIAAAVGVLDPRSLLVSWDAQGHVLRARHWLEHVSWSSGFTAWFPYWHGGFPMPDVYPPLGTWIVAALAAMGAAGWGLRLTLVAVWVLVVPVTYLFLRRLGVDRRPAAWGAALTLALHSDATFGAYAVITLGLLPNGLGFLLSIIALSELIRLLTAEAPRGAAAGLALAAGLTVLAHPFSAYWLALAAPLTAAALLALAPRARSRWPALLGAAAWAAGIGAFYWAPFLANAGSLLVTEPFEARGPADAAARLLSLRDAGPAAPALAALALAGLVSGIRRRRPAGIVLAALLAGSFVTAMGGADALALTRRFGATQWARFDGFFLWAALAAGALAFEAWTESRFSARRPRTAVAALSAFAATAAVLGMAHQRRTLASATPGALVRLSDLARALDERRRPGDFIVSENAVDAARVFGSPHFLNQRLPLVLRDVWDQGGSLPEGTAGAAAFFRLSRGLGNEMETAQPLLADGGVRFVATVEHTTRRRLDGLDWLARVWPEGDGAAERLALYEIKGFDRRFGLPPALSARVADVAFDGRYRLRLARSPAVYPLTTALAFHPWLVADVDGAPVQTASGAQNRLVLSAGPPTIETLTISYRPPAWFFPIRAAALALLAAAAGWFLASLRPLVRRA